MKTNERLEQQEQAAALKGEGYTQEEIAAKMDISRQAVQRRLAGFNKRKKIDPAIQAAMDAVGSNRVPNVVWSKTQPDGTVTHSVMHGASDDSVDFGEFVTDALSDYKPLDQKLFAPRVNLGSKGDRLAVIDLADVHFGKLSEPYETGQEYNIEVARHRVIEGTRALLRETNGVNRILFVMGNDILHTDNGKTTTSNTAQDTDGSFFTAYKAAQHATMDAIKECANYAEEVDLLHCMSNHDWRSGWALSQTIAAEMRHHDGIRATDYNLSAQHRKYYGYGRNGLVLTHGDGAKEEALTSLFLKEGRNLVNNCDLLYAYLHHFHHKKRARRGVDVFHSEKDHTAFTQINMGAANPEGVGMQAEYVRSPSAPDGWHDRNGYDNRQGVEMFIHCPHDGQKQRFTEWF